MAPDVLLLNDFGPNDVFMVMLLRDFGPYRIDKTCDCVFTASDFSIILNAF
jgi:hypothetical protein